MYQPENKKVSISVIFVYFVRPPLLGCRRRAAGVSSRNRSLRSLCTRKETLKAAIVTKATGNITESLGQAFLKACRVQRQSLWSPSADGEILRTKSLRKG